MTTETTPGALGSNEGFGPALDAKDAEIERLRWDLGELRGRIAQMERDEGKAVAAERARYNRAEFICTKCGLRKGCEPASDAGF